MVESSTSRATIQAELLALAERHIAAFDGYKVVVDDAAKGHFARYTTEGTNRLTVAKYRAAGLTLDGIKGFYSKICENQKKMNKQITSTKVGEDGGHNIYHTLASLPWPLSNRSTINAEYIIEQDGGFIYLVSSKGNEALIAANAAIIGKNVVATTIISFAKFTPYEGGFDITTVVCSDPAGSIPDALKNKQASRAAQQPVNLVNFILTGATPSD